MFIYTRSMFRISRIFGPSKSKSMTRQTSHLKEHRDERQKTREFFRQVASSYWVKSTGTWPWLSVLLVMSIGLYMNHEWG